MESQHIQACPRCGAAMPDGRAICVTCEHLEMRFPKLKRTHDSTRPTWQAITVKVGSLAKSVGIAILHLAGVAVSLLFIPILIICLGGKASIDDDGAQHDVPVEEPDAPDPRESMDVPEISRTEVTSSAINSVGYDSDEEMLEVEFSNGRVYRYFDVPEYVYDDLMDADSKGQYFNEHVRNAGYRYERQ